jgi:uncharacterized protein (DUF58 family)
MTNVGRRADFLLKLYVAAALAFSAVISPAAYSLIPILLLLWCLFWWRRPFVPSVAVPTACVAFYAIVLLFSPIAGYLFSTLIALPALALLDGALRLAGVLQCRLKQQRRGLTDMGTALFATCFLVGGLAAGFRSGPLYAGGAVMLAYLSAVTFVALRGMPEKPVSETCVQQRIVAGTSGETKVELVSRTRLGGCLMLESPCDWVKVTPAAQPLTKDKVTVRLSLSPGLAGPILVKLNGYATDCRGLIQGRFEIEPVRLLVVPRARYAAWLARKYLTNTKPGTLPMLSNIEALKPAMGLRRGIEYYGSQQYQPGDSLKNIDWKRSIRYDELISKEFTEFQGRPAVLLINTVADSDEAADRLASDILVSAISLARENIPAALAVYDNERVRLTTVSLQAQKLVLQCLQVVKGLTIRRTPARQLAPADVVRLRSNLGRLRALDSSAGRALVEVLEFEYRSLSEGARSHPVTRALNEVFSRTDSQSNIVVISGRNHDAEALAFNSFVFTRKGNEVIAL